MCSWSTRKTMCILSCQGSTKKGKRNTALQWRGFLFRTILYGVLCLIPQIMTNVTKWRRKSTPLPQPGVDETLQRPVTPSSQRNVHGTWVTCTRPQCPIVFDVFDYSTLCIKPLNIVCAMKFAWLACSWKIKQQPDGTETKPHHTEIHCRHERK